MDNVLTWVYSLSLITLYHTVVLCQVFILKFTKVVYLVNHHIHYNQNYVQTMASVRF